MGDLVGGGQHLHRYTEFCLDFWRDLKHTPRPKHSLRAHDPQVQNFFHSVTFVIYRVLF